MDAEAAIPHVLASYPTLEAPQRVERAGSAGFSAAAIWRLEAGADCWCLAGRASHARALGIHPSDALASE
jgi:hypothetical protein